MLPHDRAKKDGRMTPQTGEDRVKRDAGYQAAAFEGDMDVIAGGFMDGRPEHVRQVASWARQIVEHRVWGFETAEDIVQATLLAVVQNLRDGRFKGGDLRAYVRRIAKNMCISSYRRARSRGDQVSLGSISDPSPARTDEDRIERRIMLERMLERLKEGCRELILRAYVGGFSRKEIGDWLGISEEAARVRLYRCVENARELLSGPLISGE